MKSISFYPFIAREDFMAKRKRRDISDNKKKRQIIFYQKSAEKKS